MRKVRPFPLLACYENMVLYIDRILYTLRLYQL